MAGEPREGLAERLARRRCGSAYVGAGAARGSPSWTGLKASGVGGVTTMLRSPPSSSIACSPASRPAPCRASPPCPRGTRRRGPSRCARRSSSGPSPLRRRGTRRRSRRRRGRRSRGRASRRPAARRGRTVAVPLEHGRARAGRGGSCRGCRSGCRPRGRRGLHRLPDRALGGLGVAHQHPDAAGRSSSRIASAMPSPIGSPWPSEPVATSTHGISGSGAGWPCSGGPIRRSESSCSSVIAPIAFSAEYSSGEACPFDRTNRSFGPAASGRRRRCEGGRRTAPRRGGRPTSTTSGAPSPPRWCDRMLSTESCAASSFQRVRVHRPFPLTSGSASGRPLGGSVPLRGDGR